MYLDSEKIKKYIIKQVGEILTDEGGLLRKQFDQFITMLEELKSSYGYSIDYSQLIKED